MSLSHYQLVHSTSSLNHMVPGLGIEKICILDATEVKKTKIVTNYLMWCLIRKVQDYFYFQQIEENMFSSKVKI